MADASRLFDAATLAARSVYGAAAACGRVRLDVLPAGDIEIAVPHGWQPSEEMTSQRVAAPECFIEVLVTLFETGHRLTRTALVTAMETAGRKRAESSIWDAITQLTALGLIDNRADVNPRGYGIVGRD